MLTSSISFPFTPCYAFYCLISLHNCIGLPFLIINLISKLETTSTAVLLILFMTILPTLKRLLYFTKQTISLGFMELCIATYGHNHSANESFSSSTTN